jgi:signal transduction histidine kinase
MKLTKKLETEILKSYNAYWDSYFKGDMKSFATHLDDDCHIIGSTAFDIFKNKKSAVEFYSKTADQITGKADFRNRKITVMLFGENVMVEEFCDFYFLANEEWKFYGHCRLSTLFSEKEKGWKIIYQHGSMPYSKAQEGEQIAAKEVAEENKKLRNAIKRRTVELETKNRELEIETALERVRTVAMAMRTADDLLEICKIVYSELLSLGFKELRNVMINIHNDDKASLLNYDYSDNFGKTITDIPYNFHALVEKQVAVTKNAQDAFFEFSFEGEELKQFRELRKKNGEQDDPKLEITDALHYYFFSIGTGSIGISTYSAIQEEKLELLKRFRNVFNLSYQRYTDILKAEAQAKESQIQLALERVRARTMAMQHSEELADTATLLFLQFKNLELLPNPARVFFNLIDEKSASAEIWTSREDGGLRPGSHRVSLKVNKHLKDVFAKWKAKKAIYIAELKGKELIEHLNYLSSIPNLSEDKSLHQLMLSPPEKLVFTEAIFKHGTIGIISADSVLPESINTLIRFSVVFEQTYTRFLDLQKAEAQAIESQIQLALERVRARTMAMQKSEELQDTTLVLFQQFKEMREAPTQVSICIFDDEVKMGEMYLTLNGEKIDRSYSMELDKEIFVMKKAKEAFLHNEKTFLQTITGKELQVFNHWRNSLVGKNKWDESGAALKQSWYVTGAFFSKGMINISSSTQSSAETQKLLERFAKVFDGTYTRFHDLQKAEAQAREALIEAALERVRSRTLAMQKSDELAETSAVLFKQLIGLGIEPNRLYITIINEVKNEADFWITDEDGSKITAAYTASLLDNPTFKKMYDGWKQHVKTLTIDMHGKDLQEYFEYLQSIDVPFKSGLEQKRRVQYLAYFSNGFIGMAAPDEQPVETQQVLERFAAVFNLTFTRFNDLKIAEAHAMQAEEDLIKLQTEKRRAEDALTNLQAAQKQLVQSEKMASLGELTAGIAHEIQNPLNFVNNFSEVNREMIAEMKDEIAKGNYDEVKIIADDIEANEEKIYHHGKRADAIVKGMLQHSRSSTGVKEPTDFNALCDEYLRLTYHGLRAKDKSFNSDFKMDFDNSIGKINIVPQDIGRVLLNLINNAFYAVNEKQKITKENLPTGQAGYQPTVFLCSKKTGDNVILTVKDNGNGIPQNIVDKIFQPFFTTKPTGQGTGLGLSLSYDIIKAHGGEIKVENREGEGSEFIVQLPVV